MRRSIASLWVVAPCAALAPSALGQAASFQGLGDLTGGAYNSTPNAVSADGSVIVGQSDTANGTEAFRWTAAGGMVGLGELAGGDFFSAAAGVSGDGSIVVGSSTTGSSSGDAFRWTSAGGMLGLGSTSAGANGVNGNGSVVVGQYFNGSETEAFRWTSGTGFVGIGDVPGGQFQSFANGVSFDGNVIAGWGTRSDGGGEAFRWTSTGGLVPLGMLSGGTGGSFGFGISADGATVIGDSSNATGEFEAFRWTSAGGMQGLGALAPHKSSAARGISGDGSIIVGLGEDENGDAHAVIWDAVNGMRKLKDVLQNDYGLTLPDWTLTEARAVSADGSTIVGSAKNPEGENEGFSVRLTNPFPAGSTWNSDTDRDWHDPNNWLFTVPGADREARFMGVITAGRTIFADADATIAGLRFDSAHTYNLSGLGALTLQATSGTANIRVHNGTHRINLPTVLASNTIADVDAGATLVIADPLTINAGRTLTKTGAGTMNILSTVDGTGTMTLAVAAGIANASMDLGSDTSLHASGGVTNLKVSQKVASVNVSGSAVVGVTPGGNRTLQTRALTITGGKLEMNDNDFIVDYAPTDGSPEVALRNHVKSFVDNPNAVSGISYIRGSGDRVIAVAEKTEWGKSEFNGVALDNTTVIGKYTYYGDANLDGKVDSNDYVAVDVGLGTGNSWVQGDFNFSGAVTSDDYVAIDTNLGKGVTIGDPLAMAELKAEMIALHTAQFGDAYVQALAIAEAFGYAALVPEPGMLSVLGLGALMVRRRKGN